MKKRALGLFSLTMCALLATSCGGTASTGDFTLVPKIHLEEINIGTKTHANEEKLAKYTKDNPLKISLVTDSGTLFDHSFNESAWKGVNDFALNNGGEGSKLDDKSHTVKGGRIVTSYYQPSKYDTVGRLESMKEAARNGAKVIVCPGFLFQGAIKEAITTEKELFKDINILALDCTMVDDNNQEYQYTDKVTSVLYREEQAGFFAGYGAVMDGYNKLGFVGGAAVPAVIRYGSGFIQGASYAAQELKLEQPLEMNYYYAGEFTGTPEATSTADAWYKNGTEVIFACGGAVYTSVVEASEKNNHAKWIGVDVNQHADTNTFDTPEKQGAIITSAMKNLTNAVQVLLTSYVDNGEAWNKEMQGSVKTLGVKSNNCKLPTPEEDGDPNCWGFKKFTVDQYKAVYEKVKANDDLVNSYANEDKIKLEENNFGVDPQYCVVNYIG